MSPVGPKRVKNSKIPITPRAKGVDDNLKSYYIAVKELKDYLKAQGQDIYQYAIHLDGLVQICFRTSNT